MGRTTHLHPIHRGLAFIKRVKHPGGALEHPIGGQLDFAPQVGIDTDFAFFFRHLYPLESIQRKEFILGGNCVPGLISLIITDPLRLPIGGLEQAHGPA